MAVETSARVYGAEVSSTLRIEYLFLDLTTCTRCLGADRNLASALELRQSSCGSEACTDGCGDRIACRVSMHRAVEYTEPPAPMIVEAIPGQVYGGAAAPRASAADPYELPENLERFFSATAACCSPAEREVCCEPDTKEQCCGEGCGCR